MLRIANAAAVCWNALDYLIMRSLPRGGAFGLSGDGISGRATDAVFCSTGASVMGATGEVETACNTGGARFTCVGSTV